MRGNGTGLRVLVGLVALVFAFPASLVFLLGLLFWGDELDKTAQTAGTVVSAPRPEGPGDLGHDPERGSTACVADIEFVVDGRSFVVEADNAVSTCDLTVGERVEVHYDPADPYEHTVGSRTTNQVVGVVMMVLAGIWTLVVVAFSWAVLRFIRRRATPVASWTPGTPGTSGATGRVPLAPYETYDGGSTPTRTVPDLPPVAPPVAPPPPPVAPPAKVWDPSDTGERPDRAGWYPTGDGSLDRWYNGLSWSDATRPRGADPE